jgi:GT2 family glycosyltransferase
MNQHQLTVDCLKLLKEHIKNLEEIIIIDNSEKDFVASEELHKEFDFDFINKLKIIRNYSNLGVRESLNQGWKNSTGEIVLFMHNDLMIYEHDFDEKLKQAFEKNKEVGAIGAFGAKCLGSSDIYTKPYEMSQLARGGNISNARMDKSIHGFRNLQNDFENVAVFDGMFMCIKRELLDKVDGFDAITETFHNYDNLICIKSLQNGYENIVIGLDVDHLGGRTTVPENWSEKFGKTKQEVHEDAHPPLWRYGKGILPVMIQDIYDENAKICGYELYMNRKLVKTKIYE